MDPVGGDLVHFVVVATGSAGDDLLDVLGSLDADWRPGGDLALTVVANQCDAAALDVVGLYPWAQLIRSGENPGYGASINLAGRRMGHDAPQWLAACNADLSFPPGTLDEVTSVLSRADAGVGLIAPRLLEDGDSVAGCRAQPSVGAFPTLSSLLAGKLKDRRRRKYRPTPERAVDIDWATGACFFVRYAAFEEAAGFDPEMFLDYEDTDLCRRLANSGWRRRFEPSIRVIHKHPNAGRRPDPTRHQHSRASMIRYLAKHRPAWELRAMGALLRATVAVRDRRHPMAAGWRAGLHSFEAQRSQRDRQPEKGNPASM